MGLRKFFKKAGGWIKDKFHKVKNGVVKFAKAAAPVAKKVVNFIDKTPLSGVINTATGGLFEGAKKVINMLPDGKVKEAATNFTNKAEAVKNNVNSELDKRQEQAKGLIDRGREALDKGKAIYTTGKLVGKEAYDRAKQVYNNLQNVKARLNNM